jgi:hypothetical protein
VERSKETETVRGVVEGNDPVPKALNRFFRADLGAERPKNAVTL